MLGLVVVLPLLAAAPAPMKLASPGMSVVNVDEKVGELFSDYFARQLETEGLSVTTSQEISAILGLDRQKKLLGCTEEATDCLAELGGALGVDGIITGTIGQVGTGFTVSIKVSDARDGSAIATYSSRQPNEDAVLDWLGVTAKEFAAKVRPPEKVTLRQRAWIPAVAAGVLGAAGGVSLFQSRGIYDGIVAAPANAFSEATLAEEVGRGRTFQYAGWGLVGAGLVAGGVAAAMFALGGEAAEAQAQAPVTLIPGSDGATLVVGGTF